MENGGKLNTENNVYNEAYDDRNLDVRLKRQVREVNLSLFWNDQSIFFSNIALGIDTVEIHTGT